MAGATAGLAIVLVACEFVVAPLDPSLGAAVLTGIDDNAYGLVVDGSDIDASAPTANTSGNNRVAFWSVADDTGADEQSCATWTGADNTMQQGASLRVARSTDDTGTLRTTGITVTKNIWAGNDAVFNVHTWDTSTTDIAEEIASFDLTPVFGTNGDLPLPWRLCARVQGEVVSFEAWPTSEPPPAWDDATHGGAVSLPPGSATSGHAGLYIGHLAPGATATFTDVQVSALAATPILSGLSPSAAAVGLAPRAPHPVPGLP
jgi:hypothetical protein